MFGDLIWYLLAVLVIYFITMIAVPIIAPKGKKIVFFVLSIFVPAISLFVLVLLSRAFNEILSEVFKEISGEHGMLIILGAFFAVCVALMLFAYRMRQASSASSISVQHSHTPSNFSLPKIAASLIGLSVIYSFASMFYYGLDLQSILKGYASMRGLLSLLMLGLSGFAAYELWQHKTDGWWLGLAVSITSILLMIYTIFTYVRTGEISLGYVILVEIPTIITIIVLLLPKTRELCEVEF